MRSAKPVLWIVLPAATLTVMAGAIIGPIVNVMRERLAVDTAAAGLIVTTHALLVAISSPVTGAVIDRTGPKKPLVIGLLLYGLAGSAGALVSSFWPLLVCRALLGIAVGAIINPVTALILGLFRGSERNQAMGWRASANSVGGIVWPLVGGVLGSISWHLPFAVYLVGIPLGTLALFAVPEVMPSQESGLEVSRSPFQLVRARPTLLAIYALLFLTSVLLYTIVVFVPELLANVGMATPFQISLYFTAMGLSAAVTAFAYGRIRSRLSYRTIALAALGLWAAAFVATSVAPSAAVIALGVVLFGMGQGAVVPAVMVWVGEGIFAHVRGTAVAYLNTFSYVGQFLPPLLFGALLPLIGLGGVFLAAGALCVAMLLGFWAFVRE